jgi:hypothetical protein
VPSIEASFSLEPVTQPVEPANAIVGVGPERERLRER